VSFTRDQMDKLKKGASTDGDVKHFHKKDFVTGTEL